MKSTIASLAVALALFGGNVAAADDIYRSVMPDGSIRYGESPAPGAKSVKKVPPPPASTGTITILPEERNYTPPNRPAPGAAVLTTPTRPPTSAHEQGKQQSPQGLPQRSY